MRAAPFFVSLLVAAQWTPELSLQVKGVGSVVPSPDGTLVLWTETRAVVEPEKSEMSSQIMLGKSDGSSRFALTSESRNAGSPQWSADGKSVYFKVKTQLFRIPVDGGEAELLLDWKGNLGGIAPSPDGKQVAFTGSEERPNDEKAKKEKRDWKVIDANPENHALWLIPAEGNDPRKAKKLVGPERHITGIDWSPDSKFLAYQHTTRPEADYWPKFDISEVEVETGTVKVLANSNAAEQNPLYSADGRYIAFTKSVDPPRWAGEERIALLTRSSGETRLLPVTFDSQPALAGWAGNRVLFRESKHTRSVLYAMPVDGPPSIVYEPSSGAFTTAAANTKGTHIGLARQALAEPPEAFVLSADGGEPKQVSRANAQVPKSLIAQTKVVEWKAKDGKTVEGLLTLPAGYEPGKRYPMILSIHGGPAGVFNETFIGTLASVYPTATLAAKGYAVLRPNPRGSSGYGRDFRFANVKDWGGGDYEDLMAGVDKIIADGIADPDRLGVMGWSYGGYMTSWIVTQTRRFKGAVVGAGVTDLWSFTGTADIPGFLPDYFGGEPWDNNLDTYRKHSAMFHIKGVSTPTLVLHGENDLRVPITQGQEFYRALKRQGVTTKMVTYPRMPHGPTEPKFMLDIANRQIEWMERYVR